MVHQVAACAHQRTLARIHIRIQSDIAEYNIRPGRPIHTFFVESRPCRVGTARDLAIGFRVLAASGTGDGRGKVLLIPQLRAERFFPVHVHMIESFCRHVSLVFDDRALGPLHIREAGAAGRLNTFRLGFGDLRFC